MDIKKRCCIFTLVKNEKIFLPIWLKYYSKFFNKDDIYILDHNSDDGSIQECLKHYEFKVVTLHHEDYDETWKKEMVCDKQVQLLQSYEYVLYTDADEILVPNPKRYRDLQSYIEQFRNDSVMCAGYNLIHLREEEPPLDFSRPVLEQRKYWYPDYKYDKSLLSRTPLKWCEGFHFTTNCTSPRDNDLWLLHLHKLDFSLCWDKHQKVANLKWSDSALRGGFSRQFRITDPELFESFYYRNNQCHKKLKKIGPYSLMLFVSCYLHWLGSIILRLKFFKWQDGVMPWHQFSQHYIPVITRIPRCLKKSKII